MRAFFFYNKTWAERYLAEKKKTKDSAHTIVFFFFDGTQVECNGDVLKEQKQTERRKIGAVVLQYWYLLCSYS